MPVDLPRTLRDLSIATSRTLNDYEKQQVRGILSGLAQEKLRAGHKRWLDRMVGE